MRRADACCRSSDAAPLLVSRATAWQSMSLPAGEKQSWTSIPAEPWSGLFGSSARMTLVIPPASSALVSAKLDPLPLLRPNFHLSAFQRVLLRSERPGCGYQTRSRPRDGPEAAWDQLRCARESLPALWGMARCPWAAGSHGCSDPNWSAFESSWAAVADSCLRANSKSCWLWQCLRPPSWNQGLAVEACQHRNSEALALLAAERCRSNALGKSVAKWLEFLERLCSGGMARWRLLPRPHSSTASCTSNSPTNLQCWEYWNRLFVDSGP